MTRAEAIDRLLALFPDVREEVCECGARLVTIYHGDGFTVQHGGGEARRYFPDLNESFEELEANPVYDLWIDAVHAYEAAGAGAGQGVA